MDVESEPQDVGQPSGVVTGKASGGRRKQNAERKVSNILRKSLERGLGKVQGGSRKGSGGVSEKFRGV